MNMKGMLLRKERRGGLKIQIQQVMNANKRPQHIEKVRGDNDTDTDINERKQNTALQIKRRRNKDLDTDSNECEKKCTKQRMGGNKDQDEASN